MEKTLEQKMRKMSRLLCKWNRKEISGEEVAQKLWLLFKKENLEVWNNPLEKLIV